MRCLVTLAVVGMLALGTALAVPTEVDSKKVDRERIQKLVRQLSSESFAEREEATKALNEIGMPAYEDLKKAAQDGDPEVSRRAKEIVAKLERRIEADKVLAATKVRLTLKDVPVAEAIAELAKKSGYQIVLADAAKVADRKVTLDTGETTFWQAFDQLCQAAGLVEGAGARNAQVPPQPIGGPIRVVPIQVKPVQVLPVIPPQKEKEAPEPKKDEKKEPVKDDKKDEVQPVKAKPVVAPLPVQAVPVQVAPAIFPAPPAVAAPSQIVLMDGKYVAYPTCYAGAVRLRVLPSSEKPSDPREVIVNIEIRAEPKMSWRQLESLRIDKAMDDVGQKLEQASADLAPMPLNGPGGIAVARAVRRRVPQQPTASVQLVPVRLKLQDKPSKVLKEFAGMLAAQVQIGPEPLVTVNNVLKATGQTVKGDKGGALTVHEASKLDNGQYKLRVTVQPPDGQGGGFGGFGGIQINGINGVQNVQIQAIGGVPGNAGIEGLSLEDAKGQKFQQAGVGTKVMVNNNMVSMEYTITYQPQKDQGEPAKLVLSGVRNASIEFPFSFKDVPLN